MKFRSLKTKKGKFAIMELADRNEIQGKQGLFCIPGKGLWQFIDYVDNITEEQARQIVNSYYTEVYEANTGIRNTYGYRTALYEFNNALDCFKKLVSSNVLFENPLGKQPSIMTCRDVFDWFERRYVTAINKESREEWEKQQVKVWDKDKTIILKKLNQQQY